MPIYYVNLDVRFKRPLDLFEGDGSVATKKIAGYLQGVGATFPNPATLESAIADVVFQDQDEDTSNVEIVYDYVGIIPEEDLQSEIYDDEDIKDSLISSPYAVGVWYKTGKGYYSNG